MSRIARGALVSVVLALVVSVGLSVSGAAADGTATTPTTTTPTTPTTPTPTTPPTTTTPVAPVAPAAGALRMNVTGTFSVASKNVTVTGRSAWVNLVATPFVAGQAVTVRVRNGRRLIASKTVTLTRSRGGDYGHYSVRFSSGSPGNLEITAVHNASPQQVRFAATAKKVDVVSPDAGPGARGVFVSLIQSRLAALHFYVLQDGVYDTFTQNAILAYRKVRGWDRIFTLDSEVIRGLPNGVGSFPVRYPHQGRHVEADLTDQVLAEINGANVYQIYPISSGKPSTPTILGQFRVYTKTPGYLPDGMYYSNFFYSGYAIHGYDPSPTYPASHGCLRLPIDDAINVYQWVQIGTPVDTYYGAN